MIGTGTGKGKHENYGLDDCSDNFEQQARSNNN